jgi:hypothetical protein
LPDSELGYNDSQKKLGNFLLPFVVRMKPVEIANYYCPEKQTKQGDAGYPLRLGLTSGWPEVAGVIGTRWKMCFDLPILLSSPLEIARDSSQGRPGWGLGPLAYLVGPQRNDRERAFLFSYALLDGKRRFETSYPTFILRSN